MPQVIQGCADGDKRVGARAPEAHSGEVSATSATSTLRAASPLEFTELRRSDPPATAMTKGSSLRPEVTGRRREPNNSPSMEPDQHLLEPGADSQKASPSPSALPVLPALPLAAAGDEWTLVDRCHRLRASAVECKTSLIADVARSSFDPLRHEAVHDDSLLPACWQKAQGKMTWRVLREMFKYHPCDGIPATNPTSELSDSAAHLKASMLSYLKETLPSTKREVLSRKASAFWNRVSLHRLRHKDTKQWYLVVNSVDGQQRVLVLHVPPAGLRTPEEQERHDSADDLSR